MKSISRWLAPLLAAALVPSAVLAAGIESIEVLSGRADTVTGGDALVAVNMSRVDPSKITMTLNGIDVTSMFGLRPNGRYQGMVRGLAEGDNELRARLPDGTGARITLRNYPIGGPVFSGAPVEPWLCRTQNQNNPTLGPALDAKCNAPTVVEFFYRNRATPAQFVSYNPANPPTAGVIAETVTDQGRTVPFIVQRVTGTANRGIYQMAVLVDPTKPIEPWSTEQPWNHKLYFTYGGACSTNYQQPTVGNVLGNVTQLQRGFVVATSSLATFGNQCNDIISAEATMTAKEIVVERYGELRYTIGAGGSAGTMQQHLVSEAYPGLLDGLLTSQAFEDHWYQVTSSFDCIVLWRYFGLASATLGLPSVGNPLWPNSAERRKVWGSHPADPDNLCGQKLNAFGAPITELIATSPLGCAGPPNNPPWRYDPVTNPLGTRCTSQDYQKAMFGVGPDNKAPRPIDNVGLQYGLDALIAGAISAEQFVDINHRIGGLDIDGNWQPQRSAADVGAIATLYRTGRNVSGRGAALVAEIDVKNNLNDTGFHPAFHSWSFRARLDKLNGNHDGQVIWIPNGGQTPDAFLAMDAWLAAVEADASGDALPVKIARNKPATVFDACYRSGGVVQDLTCNGEWQYYGSPRFVAGMPPTNDVFKCQLKPLAPADYPVSFTADQWARLQEAFPGGVCDWSKPAVAQEPSLPWVSFAAGPGGQPLGEAPKSIGVNAPVARCKNVTLQACSAQVDVNDGSFDPDGDLSTLAQSPAGPYPLGTTRVTLAATDALGLTGSCQADVRLVDVTSPSVSGASASPASLWPPNKRMVAVSVAVAAADNCAGNVSSSCRIVAISGDDSATPADWRITGALSASLRADRSGKGGGRTYALTVECADPSGNASRQVVTVLVPHDRGE